MALDMSVEGVAVRPFERADIAEAHALSNAFGWPQRIEDWQWFGAFGRGFVAVEDGAMVGTALHWDYDASTSSIGAVMVDPRLQGRGIGRRLTAACLDALRDRTIILHATEAGRPLYESFGFAARGTLTQYQGVIAADIPQPAGAGADIVPLTNDLAEAAIMLAEQGSGLRRAALMASLIALSEGAVLIEDGKPAGLSLFRRYCKGWAIGPVIAPNEDAAGALIAYWLRRNAGKPVRIDVTAQAGDALHAWLRSTGLEAASSATPMVRGIWPQSRAPQKQFAVVTQATG